MRNKKDLFIYWDKVILFYDYAKIRFGLPQVFILKAMPGNSAQSDRAAPAGNQQLICLRSLLINMDNSDPVNG